MGDHNGIGRGKGHALRGIVDMKALAHAFSEKRKSLGLSLRDVRGQCGVSQSTLSRLETRSNIAIDIENLNEICKWLGVPIERFMLEHGQSDAVTYLPNEPIPSIVDAFLRKDETLTPEARQALSDIFRTAYEEFSHVDKQHGHKGYQENNKKAGSSAGRATSRKV